MKIGELSAASSTPIDDPLLRAGRPVCHCRRAREGNFHLRAAASGVLGEFIRYCRSLDMSLDEVRVLLRFRDDSGDCGDVNALLDEHRAMSLSASRNCVRWSGSSGASPSCGTVRTTEQCGILAGLAEAAGACRSGQGTQPSEIRSRLLAVGPTPSSPSCAQAVAAIHPLEDDFDPACTRAKKTAGRTGELERRTAVITIRRQLQGGKSSDRLAQPQARSYDRASARSPG